MGMITPQCMGAIMVASSKLNSAPLLYWGMERDYSAGEASFWHMTYFLALKDFPRSLGAVSLINTRARGGIGHR